MLGRKNKAANQGAPGLQPNLKNKAEKKET